MNYKIMTKNIDSTLKAKNKCFMEIEIGFFVPAKRRTWQPHLLDMLWTSSFQLYQDTFTSQTDMHKKMEKNSKPFKN
jgi:hypothetical protein